MIRDLKNENRNRILILVLSFLVLLLSFKSSNQWSYLPIGNELIWWVIQIIFFVILLQTRKSFSSPQLEKNLFFVKLYLSWNIICIIRGAFTAENYWEWKNLVATSFFLLLPLLVYVANSFLSLQKISKTWFKYALFMYIPFIPFIWGDGVGRFLMPISFLLLFFPILNMKWKIIVLLVTIYVMTFDITARSNVIKFIVPLMIGLLFYIRKTLAVKFLNTIRLLLLFAPLGLFFVAASGVFNVFKMDEYIDGEYNAKANVNNLATYEGPDEESLVADTRTFLYIEVLESALLHEYVLLGRTPARGNDSAYFGEFNKLQLNTGKLERFSNEVSILNIFTWLGAVGVILYFLVFIKASYLAINQSNNIFIKLIGINVAFRWAYGFVEDFSEFDLSNIFLWIMIGMCFSVSFRKMTDLEFKMWVRGILANKKTMSKKLLTNLNFKRKS